MTTAELVVEYLRVLLTWPVAVAILGLVFLKQFSGPIDLLLSRIASIRAAG